jgi:hypothetical protein
MKGGKYAVLLVMRAKESEGVEFRDEDNKNLFSDMILAGLPYPDISDALVRRRECGDSVVVKLQILGLTFSPIRLGLWSTSWCECSYLLPSLPS